MGLGAAVASGIGGIADLIGGAGTALSIGSGLGLESAAGVATGLGAGLEAAGTGALLGGGLTALKGGNVLTGALEGGAIGGGISALGALGGASGSSAGTTLGTLNDGTVLGASNATGGNMILDDNGDPLTDANGNLLYENTAASPQTLSDGTQLNPVSQTTGSTGSTGTSAAKTGGTGGSSLGGLLGGGGAGGAGGISNTSLMLGALSALSATQAPTVGTWTTPGPSSVTSSPTFNAPLNTNVPGRTATNPGLPTGAQPNYWSYGGPEQQYFSNNSTAAYGFAKGGALSRAEQQGEWTVARNGHHVQGAGTGTSDKVPAMLSNDEYVMTYDDLARIGALYGKGEKGDANEKGARVLDHVRKDLAHKTGQPQFAPKRLGRALNEPVRTGR